MRAFLIVAAIVIAAATVEFGQNKPSAASTIQGVWKTISVTTAGANPTSDNDIPASIVIYTRSHLSIVRDELRETTGGPCTTERQRETDRGRAVRLGQDVAGSRRQLERTRLRVPR